MRHHAQALLGRIAIPILCGIILGATAALLYAGVCTGIGWMFGEKFDHFLPWLIRFGVSGAMAGALMGTCVAIDWSKDAKRPVAVTATKEPDLAPAVQSQDAKQVRVPSPSLNVRLEFDGYAGKNHTSCR